MVIWVATNVAVPISPKMEKKKNKHKNELKLKDLVTSKNKLVCLLVDCIAH
jgi:hypothetical protein